MSAEFPRDRCSVSQAPLMNDNFGRFSLVLFFFALPRVYRTLSARIFATRRLFDSIPRRNRERGEAEGGGEEEEEEKKGQCPSIERREI